MSGTMPPPNTLQGAGSPAAPAPNALASAGQGAPKAPPMPQGPPSVSDVLASLQAANPSPHALADRMELLNHVTPVLAKLAADTDISRKDVVRAVADAVAAKKLGATEGIQFLTSMPESAEQLQSWIHTKYQAALVANVAMHAHAHQLVGAAAPPGGTPAEPPVPPQTVPHPLAPRIMPGPGPVPSGLGTPQ